MLGVFDGFLSFAIAENRGNVSGFAGRLSNRVATAKQESEKGFVLAFCSITLLVLTAVGGFAVDVGNWYWNASRMQNAADSAALAGAVYLPGRPDLAEEAAKQALAKNGFENAVFDTKSPTGGVGEYGRTPNVYITQDPNQPNQLHVEIGVTTSNYFISLLGIDEQKLVRKADAIYEGTVQMGSPGNVLGAEPLQPGQPSVMGANASRFEGFNGKYWLNAAGGRATKVSGDRYMAGRCGGAEKCNGDTNAEVGTGTGGEREHRYIVHIPKDTNTAVLQAFDAAYVNVGDHCEVGTLGSAALRSLAVSGGDDPDLYARGAGSKYCTGDNAQGGSGAAPALTFEVKRADGNKQPSGSLLERITFPALDNNSASNESSLVNAIRNTSLGDSFRKWSTVATFTEPGDYIVSVSTPENSVGANRFSLRLGVGNAASQQWSSFEAGKVTVSAQHHLTVYTNATGTDTAFYFAKMTDQVAGRTITFELYDIGDVGRAESVDLQLLRPNNSRGDWITECIQNGAGRVDFPLPGCEIKGAKSSVYNGKIVKLTMKIPSSYSCTDNGTSDCWMSLRFKLNNPDNVSAAQPSTDTTTWQINDCGNPLRLTNPSDESTFSEERTCAPDRG